VKDLPDVPFMKKKTKQKKIDWPDYNDNLNIKATETYFFRCNPMLASFAKVFVVCLRKNNFR
jgi:hypothetical protein